MLLLQWRGMLQTLLTSLGSGRLGCGIINNSIWNRTNVMVIAAHKKRRRKRREENRGLESFHLTSKSVFQNVLKEGPVKRVS